MRIDKAATWEFKKHAINEYPKEAVGFIVNDEYVGLENIADDPYSHFRVKAELFIDLKPQAILHTHPITKELGKWPAEWPSHNDMVHQIRSNVPWGIASTDGESISEIVWIDDNDRPDLIGREFIHGINDCYSIIRDYYKQVLNIELRNYPRQVDWWDKGQDLYSENFESENFVEVQDPQIHDVALFRVRSPVINHAAVITGQNEILHHLFHRLSGRDRLDKWTAQIVKYIRHKDLL